MTGQEDELRKRAIDSLIKDAQQWQKRRDREFRATQQQQPTLNKMYLKNLLSNNENHNDRIRANARKRRAYDERGKAPRDSEARDGGKKPSNRRNSSDKEKTEGDRNVPRRTRYIDREPERKKRTGLKIEIGFRKRLKETHSAGENVAT